MKSIKTGSSLISTSNERFVPEESKNSYTIIDLHTAFVDDKGLIIEDFFSDGIHLTEQGYNNWVKIISHEKS